MSTPIRVQLKREKGWRLPEGVHIADRRTVFGNPFKVWRARGAWFVEDVIEGEIGPYWTEEEALAVSLALYREYLHDHPEIVELARGKSLACWCRIGRPCHADILIDIANRGVVRDGYWRRDWREGEREALEDLQAGRSRRFDSTDDMLDWLFD